MQGSEHKENKWRYNQTVEQEAEVFTTAPFSDCEPKETRSTRRTTQAYKNSCSKEMRHYTVTFIGAVWLLSQYKKSVWPFQTPFCHEHHLNLRLKSTCTMIDTTPPPHSHTATHTLTHTNKTKPTEDNLWPHSEHLLIHGRCLLCIGCVTVSPNMNTETHRKIEETEWAVDYPSAPPPKK